MKTFAEYLREQDEIEKRKQREALGTLIGFVAETTQQVAQDLHGKHQAARDVHEAVQKLINQKTFDLETPRGTQTISMADVVADDENKDVLELLSNIGTWMKFVGKKEKKHIGKAGSFLYPDRREAVIDRFFPPAPALPGRDDDIKAAVAQIQRLRTSLIAVPHHHDPLSIEDLK